MTPMARFRRGLTYSNVMATAAVFIALGGGAWAVSKNSVDAKAIENGTVRSQELKDDDVRARDVEAAAVGADEVADGSLGGAEVADGSLSAADVADGSVTGAEVADGSLGGADVAGGSINGSDVADDSLDAGDVNEEDFYFGDLQSSGALASHARALGGAGTVYGPIAGRAQAGASAEEVVMALPPALFGNLAVFLSADLVAGQSRTFTVVLQSGPGEAEEETDITCTVTASQDRCFDFGGQDATATSLASIRVESSGAGLGVNDDAYIGMSVKTPLGAGPLGP